MKRAFQLIFAFLLVLAAIALAVSSCTSQSALRGGETAPAETPAETEAPAPVETPAETEAPAPPETPAEAGPETPVTVDAPEQTGLPEQGFGEAGSLSAPSMAEMTPAERAAAWGLPAPPEGIDLSATEFKLANSYNSITDKRPNHSMGAGVIVDAVADEAFNNFVGDCVAAGYGVSAFRGYLDWWTVLENYYEPEVFAHGAEYAASATYVPGCNDHQTALCIDLRLGGTGYLGEGVDFRGTEAWDWLLAHCAEYGIILRYPEGQESWYGTACVNPCHFRYVGEAAAKYIVENNITLEQFMLLYDWESIYVPGVN